MRISKTETANFENYAVTMTTPNHWLGLPFILPWMRYNEISVLGIIEADDVTGRIVRQVLTVAGEPVFSNGVEDIILSNEVKLLLLVPPIQSAFLQAGFAPKVVVSFEKNVRIVNKNPTVEVIVPTQQQSLEAEDAY